MTRQVWIDTVFVSGLALMCGGIGMLSIPAALIATGIVLMIVAIFGAVWKC